MSSRHDHRDEMFSSPPPSARRRTAPPPAECASEHLDEVIVRDEQHD